MAHAYPTRIPSTWITSIAIDEHGTIRNICTIFLWVARTRWVILFSDRYYELDVRMPKEGKWEKKFNESNGRWTTERWFPMRVSAGYQHIMVHEISVKRYFFSLRNFRVHCKWMDSRHSYRRGDHFMKNYVSTKWRHRRKWRQKKKRKKKYRRIEFLWSQFLQSHSFAIYH